MHLKRRIKLITLQVLASYGVFVLKNDQFSVDLEEVNKEVSSIMDVFKRALPTTPAQQWSKNASMHVGSVLGPLVANCVKKLDRVVTEAAGCDSYIQVL